MNLRDRLLAAKAAKRKDHISNVSIIAPTSSTEYLCPPSRLLSLPPEIRNRILCLVLVHPNVYLSSRPGFPKISKELKASTGILRVCRQTRAEGNSIFYSNNIFHLPSNPSSGFDVLHKIHRWNRWQIRHLAIRLSDYDIYQHEYQASAAKLGYANAGPDDLVKTVSHVRRWAREMAESLHLNWISRLSQICDYHWEQVRTGRPGLADLTILPLVELDDGDDPGKMFSMSQLYDNIISLDEFDTSTTPKYVEVTRYYFEARGWFSAGKAEPPLLRDLLSEMNETARDLWISMLENWEIEYMRERMRKHLWPGERTTEDITSGN